MARTSSADRKREGERNGGVERSQEAGRQAAVRGLNKTRFILRGSARMHTHIQPGRLLGQDGTRKGCLVHTLISKASDSSGVSTVHRGLCCVK